MGCYAGICIIVVAGQADRHVLIKRLAGRRPPRRETGQSLGLDCSLAIDLRASSVINCRQDRPRRR